MGKLNINADATAGNDDARLQLSKLLEEIRKKSPSTDDKNMTWEEIEEFYTNYYVKSSMSESKKFSIKPVLSSIEENIISYFLNRTDVNQPYLFVDHAGKGKSTILKYISSYLIDKESSLRDKVVSIYISLSIHDAEVSECGDYYSTRTLLYRKISLKCHTFFKKILFK